MKLFKTPVENVVDSVEIDQAYQVGLDRMFKKGYTPKRNSQINARTAAKAKGLLHPIDQIKKKIGI